ncbi:putative kinase inhibitor [Cedecea lapagei]|uniref:Putative kinase inhibitor n=1 Tax=Cedecea lapagei TaxID=158823 RepID=A0A3S4J0J3_9ENTR|nr:kinase inhibitor [Cedecea lapagei]VEB95382.1 putative kinase inhibitor [Cedecea lapagei]
MKKHIAVATLAFLSLSAEAAGFQVKSSEIKTGMPLAKAQVFEGFGCSGGNQSPELSWSGAPKGTKSFAVTAYDPDAPTGSGWWHWTVVNIPASVTSLADDAGNKDGTKLPAGAVQGRNDYGYAGFGGACPPKGDQPHHYHFKVWALKTDKLPIDANASGALVGYMLTANKIATAEVVPIYGIK